MSIQKDSSMAAEVYSEPSRFIASGYRTSALFVMLKTELTSIEEDIEMLRIMRVITRYVVICG